MFHYWNKIWIWSGYVGALSTWKEQFKDVLEKNRNKSTILTYLPSFVSVIFSIIFFTVSKKF